MPCIFNTHSRQFDTLSYMNKRRHRQATVNSSVLNGRPSECQICDSVGITRLAECGEVGRCFDAGVTLRNSEVNAIK